MLLTEREIRCGNAAVIGVLLWLLLHDRCIRRQLYLHLNVLSVERHQGDGKARLARRGSVALAVKLLLIEELLLLLLLLGRRNDRLLLLLWLQDRVVVLLLLLLLLL